jgi:hypothetical protein
VRERTGKGAAAASRLSAGTFFSDEGRVKDQDMTETRPDDPAGKNAFSLVLISLMKG